MLKKSPIIILLLLSFSLVFTEGTSQAAESDNTAPVTIPNINNTESLITENENVSPAMVNPYRTRKKNVTYSYEWSPYKRASANLNTYNSSGGSITSDRKVTFGVSVTGTISGLGISTSKTISSRVGYTLKVPKNKRVYLGYRVRYKVEKGTREYYDSTTGRVKSSNKYTVKTPTTGEFKLINY